MNWSKRNGTNSTKRRIIVTLCLLCAIVVFGSFLFHCIANKRNKLFEDLQKNEIKNIADALIRNESGNIDGIVADYSCFDEMQTFVSKKDKKWAKKTITVINNHNLQAVWVYDLNKKQVYSEFDTLKVAPFDLPANILDLLYKKRYDNFYLNTSNGLMQISGSTIHKTYDRNRKGKPSGFFAVGKLWDTVMIKNFVQFTGSFISLTNVPKPDNNKGKHVICLPLKSIDNQDIAYLCIAKTSTFDKPFLLWHFYSYLLLCTLVLILLISFQQSYKKLVLQPLNRIVQALDTENISTLDEMIMQKDEFGKIARLIDQFFKQKTQLNNDKVAYQKTKAELESLNDELFKQNIEIEEQHYKLEELYQELILQKEELETQTENLQQANTKILLHTQELDENRKEIEKHHKEITGNMRYASVIQMAVLPTDQMIQDILKENFLIYWPKDIVSGDFYWIRRKKDTLHIAIADCTGHGLAGALMSMLGVSFMDAIYNQNSDLPANEFLNRLRDQIVSSLHQKGEYGEAQDGIDVSLCIIHLPEKKMEFSGAFSRMYIAHTVSETNTPTLSEYKGDPMPTGIYLRSSSFTNHIIDISFGDMIYMFTDGFIDQFGGEHNKKFKSRRLKDLLTSVCRGPMYEQKEKISKKFLTWKGNNEQVDDVTLFGCRILP
jgi:serine phosphatase RsbU (regulator of sigma subunit)